MDFYVPRTLHFIDDNGKTRRIEEAELVTTRKPVVILAEPGMGKTWLLRRLEKLPNHVFRSAASFVAHPRPSDFAPAGATLLIDGLDELSAARESDPIYRVLGKLIEAGCPPFILSCRAADWRGAVARQDIADDYGAPPQQMWLDPFSRDNAVEALSPTLGSTQADALVATLEQRGIPDLYGNPLTLELLAAIAAEDETLPTTRAGLLQRAAELLWREISDRKLGSPLSTLDTETALGAAGALSAAFVLTGSEVIALNPSDAVAPATLPVAEVGQLPRAKHARSLLGSRLFAPVPGADGRFKPIHRTIAEFLGARWLAAAVSDELGCDRLHAALTIDDGVPASLRGIHAWLALDTRFAGRVIDTDPYGVLRYGDADGLSIDQGRRILDALKTLQQANPYFRAGDWSTLSAKGLTHIELLDDVRGIILDEATTFHLRTLLLGIVRGSPLAAALALELEHILFDGSFTYAERHEAALALARLETHKDRFRPMVERLGHIGTEDATRLALDMMQDVEFRDFSARDIAAAVLANLGLLPTSQPTSSERSRSTSLFDFARGIPDAGVSGVLDYLAITLPRRESLSGSEIPYDLELLVSHLIGRQIRLGRPEPDRLLSWLRIIAGHDVHRGDDQQHIAQFLRGDDNIRRAIQLKILTERGDQKIWNRIWDLAQINSALTLSVDDVVHHLVHLASRGDRSDQDIALWRELAAFARSWPEATSRIIDAARPFAVDRTELQTHLDELLKPLPAPQWEIDRIAKEKARSAKRDADRARHRYEFSQHEAELRSGELRWVHAPAQAYLGLFSDIGSELCPPERIGEWLGHKLQAAALAGFEAVLHRPDLPTFEQVCQSYAESRRWHFVFPMIAGVAERVRTGQGIGDLRPDTLSIVLVGLLNEHLGDRIPEGALPEALETELRANPAHFERHVRLLIEPSLARQVEHISGLYAFARSIADEDLARQLSVEWLERYPDLPTSVEAELTDILLRAGDQTALQKLYPSRLGRSHADDKRTRSWQALALLSDFPIAAHKLTPVATESRELLWYLRDRLGSERRKPRTGIEIAPTTLAWIVEQFRALWPNQRNPSSSWSGDTNPWDAAEFILSIIDRLASDTSDAAVALLQSLCKAPQDSYTGHLLYASDQQRRSRREINFAGVSLPRLVDVLLGRPPRTIDDILSIVVYTLGRLQSQLRGNDTDTVNKYWRDDGTPRDEDSCTDLLIEDIERLIPRLGINRVPQRDMPANKRADIVFTAADAALPVECKAQWNETLWTAASTQLDALYLRDWQAQDRGLYVVYWFGPNVPQRCALRVPQRVTSPLTPEQLRRLLVEALPPLRRGSISVAVLDLSRP